jgi:hypothetical protein
MTTMTLPRFLRLLGAYGAAPHRWPEAERTSALELLASSDEARAALDKASGLDAALAGSSALPDAAALARMRAHVARQVARAPLPARPGFWHWLRPVLPMGGGALATALACALWLAFSAQPIPASSDDSDFTAPRQITLAMMESRD